MFHPERLTGARRRKYLYMNSAEYAPTLPITDIPKTIRKMIRHPERLKAIMRVGFEGGKYSHYIAVVGYRIALIDHADEDAERTIGFLTGGEAWECQCNRIREMYKTWTMIHPKRYGNKIIYRDKPLAYARNVNDLPKALVDIREKCRKPKRQYRYVERTNRGHIRDARREFTSTYSDSLAKSPPYVLNILNRLSTQLGTVVSERVELRIAKAITRILGIRTVVKYRGPYYKTEFGFEEISYNRDRVLTVAFYADPYTYYSRVMHGNIKSPPGVVCLSSYNIGKIKINIGVNVKEIFGEFKSCTGSCEIPMDDFPKYPFTYWTAGMEILQLSHIEQLAHRRNEYAARVVHKLEAHNRHLMKEDNE